MKAQQNSENSKIKVLGIAISRISKAEILDDLKKSLEADDKKTGTVEGKAFIVTPYSEFFYRSFRDYHFKDALNRADYALPDGIGTIWVAHFLNKPFVSKSFYEKIGEAFWQLIWTGLEVFLNPKALYSEIPEKISGSDFFWDLAKLAHDNDKSIFLLGAMGNTAELVAEKLKKKFPGIKIAGTSNISLKNADHKLIEEINKNDTDILMVAFGPVKQETWIDQNLSDLKIKIAIGLGGTFDYVAGKKLAPPKFIRDIGLEWLFRLVTQPARFKRIWHSTFSFVLGAFREKVFSSMPYRQNVVGVIINNDNKVLIAKRAESSFVEGSMNEDHWQFPQGGIDDQKAEIAVLREMHEEVGLSDLEILGVAETEHTYLWNHSVRELFFNPLPFKGQSQKIFFLKYSGSDDDVKIDNKEFKSYEWVEIKEIPKRIHHFRSSLTKIITEEIQRYVSK